MDTVTIDAGCGFVIESGYAQDGSFCPIEIAEPNTAMSAGSAVVFEWIPDFAVDVAVPVPAESGRTIPVEEF